MLILDTDHLTALDRGGDRGARLERRLDPRHGEVWTTIVSVGEQLHGLLVQIASARSEALLFERYQRLSVRLDRLTEHRILPWTHEAAARLTHLRRLRIRIGTMDLRIASIALTNDATLLSANMRDFSKIPGLRVEDWLHE